MSDTETIIDTLAGCGFDPTDDEIPAKWLARWDAWTDRSSGGYLAASFSVDEGTITLHVLTASGVTEAEVRFPTSDLGLSMFDAAAELAR